MNKNENRFKNYLDKANNNLGKIIGTISLIILGIIVEKLWNSLPDISTIFYHNVYSQFHEFSYKSFYLWFYSALASLVFGAICLYEAIRKIISKNYISFIYFIFILFICVFNFSTSASTISAIKENRDISTNLEIIHPYISEKEYIKFKSELLQVDSKQSFDKINYRIRNIANKYNANIN
ncbi:hypothetical protein SM192_11410 [Lactococcus lactis]|nr:hypothetical protein [Lactococcus lactis]